MAAYVSLVLSIYASQRWWKLLQRIGITKGGELIALLALTYLLMLVPQLLRDINHGDKNGQVVRRGFYFSMVVGGCWAFLQFMGSQDEAPPIIFFYVLALFYGFGLGLVSMVIANTMFGFRRLK
jgi:hypothetical protein